MFGHRKTSIEGRPLNPQSIFIGIQRSRLPTRSQIESSLQRGAVLTVPVRFLGRWERLIGTVRQVRMFNDGMLLFIDPSWEGSVLKTWPSVEVWIPNQGSAGVLA